MFAEVIQTLVEAPVRRFYLVVVMMMMMMPSYDEANDTISMKSDLFYTAIFNPLP